MADSRNKVFPEEECCLSKMVIRGSKPNMSEAKHDLVVRTSA